MYFIEMIFYTLLVLGVLVTFHEFGHFWVARRCGVKVLRFSVGFGTPLLRWRDRYDTEFVIAALPLGGYVKMVDEREGDVAEDQLEQAFNRKPVGARMAIVSAGPIANFILAVLAYWIVFFIGVGGVAPVIDEVEPESIAHAAGLEPGQEIIAVDGVATPTRQAVVEQLVKRIGEDDVIRFTVRYPDSNLKYESEAALDGWDIDGDAPNPIGGIGLTLYWPKVLPVANEIVSGSPADVAGIQKGDLVLSADGVAIEDWDAWVNYVRARPERPIDIEVERSGEVFALTVTPRSVVGDGAEAVGQVGMSVLPPEWPEGFYRETSYGLAGGLSQALKKTGETSIMILDSIKKMILGDISVKHLSGPITIAKVAGASADHGLVSFLQFVALLSISLAVLNLLPVPVLDGGHLAYYLVELIKGSPVSDKVQELGYRVGLFLIIGLMGVAIYNDIARL